MELWFTEKHTPSTGITIKVKEQLYHGKSDYQDIEILNTEQFGKLLLLDGLVMLTEKDEFIYHEMIAHIPLFSHPNPKNVLVIGGGDGGTVRETLRHDNIKSVDFVEIDGEVIDVCKKYMPDVCRGIYSDERLRVHVMDGFEFLKNPQNQNKYDVIIVDSTDPIGPGVVLIEEDFYQLCNRALKEDGILTAQSESPFYNPEWVKKIFRNLGKVFPTTEPYTASIPTYPSGTWLFAYASKKYSFSDCFEKEKVQIIEDSFGYYNSKIHESAFVLPNFVKRIIE